MYLREELKVEGMGEVTVPGRPHRVLPKYNLFYSYERGRTKQLLLKFHNINSFLNFLKILFTKAN